MALKEYLTAQGVRAIVSHRLKNNKKRVLVGWGAKAFDFNPGTLPTINNPADTSVLSCKKRFFQHVKSNGAGDHIVEFCTDRDTAVGWNSTVVVRSTTSGSGGAGITVVDPGEEIPQAPLYTKYQKKTKEYRVHCFRDDTWSLRHFQQKVFVKTEDKPEPDDWRIRNHTFGFTFQALPEDRIPEAVKTACMGVLGTFPSLNFVALDVIYHEPTNVALVLEGNTAPGLEGDRLQVYGDYLKEIYKKFK